LQRSALLQPTASQRDALQRSTPRCNALFPWAAPPACAGKIARDAAADARYMCKRHYGFAPEVCLPACLRACARACPWMCA
jgi:hypothetical protein